MTTSYSEKFNQARINSRDIAELIGICKGVLADAVLDISECYFIYEWLESHISCINTWPASVLHKSLTKVLEDGKLSPEEESEMLEILCGITGITIETKYLGQTITANTSTTLPVTPLNSPINFEGSAFVLTGKFEYGARSTCETEVIKRGGTTQKAPTKTTHYLVIGNIGNDQWAQSSFGRKIEKAIAMNETGHDIKIISETEWVKHL